jgi:3-deoxy-7-phosphoheptulonate synthase
LCEKLNPDNIAGKITLITRYGANRISEELPKAIEVVKNEGLNVVWCCDPMHGNTTTINNHKTRIFDNILEEIKSFWQIHNEHGTYPGGVHIELTGDNVTECIGGLAGITNANLSFNYTTHCDPRLNSNQALQLAFEIADILKV